MSQFENVTVTATANVYFDGKCISYSMEMADGSKKSVGVIFPSSLTFGTAAPETMQINAGSCRIRKTGEDNWVTYSAGESFEVPGDSSFDIETLEMVDYICHYG